MTGTVHDVLAPAWHAVAGDCHLNRETDDAFRSDDRFELVDHSRVSSVLSSIVPVVRGTPRRR
ncbi:hypothetical protein [Halosimplex amylolyticum]|uniref:hypothetical protein n=1 Tax=Halosimplex amylolyticum TaxID=3396616 RepID=UPI003F56083E